MNVLADAGLFGQRCLIIHHDDLGYFAAMVRAFRFLPYKTGSVMWLSPHAQDFVGSGSRYDLGVHLTLTSEIEDIPLRPITNGRSLVTDTGRLWPSSRQVWDNVDAHDAENEFRAQIACASANGVDTTHLDAHMGCFYRPDIADRYVRLLREYGLPGYIPSSDDGEGFAAHYYFSKFPDLEPLCASAGLPRITLIDMYCVPPADRRQWCINRISTLGPGLYMLIHHASAGNRPVEHVKDWEGRESDFDVLRHSEVQRVISECTVLTFSRLRDLFRRYR